MSLLALFLRFFRIGAFTIGGGVVMIGVIEAELRATKLLSDEEIADMIVLATAVPGPMATNLSWLAGGRLPRTGGAAPWGLAGSAIAVLGTALAPFLTILLLSGFLVRYLGSPWTVAFFRGASVGVVVTVGWAVLRITRRAVTGWPEIAGYATTVFLLLGLRIHPFAALMTGTAVCALCLFASVGRSSWERS